jgi:hypothetical protein
MDVFPELLKRGKSASSKRDKVTIDWKPESRVNCASEDIESSNTGWSDDENWIRMAVLYHSDATEFLAYGFDHVCFPTSRRAVDVEKLLLHLFIGQYPAIGVNVAVEQFSLLWCKAVKVDWFRLVVFDSVVPFLLINVGSYFVNVIPSRAGGMDVPPQIEWSSSKVIHSNQREHGVWVVSRPRLSIGFFHIFNVRVHQFVVIFVFLYHSVFILPISQGVFLMSVRDGTLGKQFLPSQLFSVPIAKSVDVTEWMVKHDFYATIFLKARLLRVG